MDRELTTVYFVRHCKPDHKNMDDRNRPLTEEGLADSQKVMEVLRDKKIDVFISSPYRRSYDTIKLAAESYGKQIETDERLRERKAGENGNTHEMFRKRWADFSYAEAGGEPIGNVQKRNIEALDEILDRYNGKTIAIGTHGTALSSIMNFYDPSFNADSFMRIVDFMPYIVKMEFDEKKRISFEEIFYIHKEFKD